MSHRLIRRLPVVLLSLLALVGAGVTARGAAATSEEGAVAGGSTEMTFSHDDWTTVLVEHVDARGMVSYQALGEDRQVLDRYLRSLSEAGPMSRPELFPSRNDSLAYYLNAYNANTLSGVLAGGGEQKSVWGSMLSGYKFFVGTKYIIDGQKMSLKRLEDKLIRDGFKDPRIHAALVCASISCPRLPQEAFAGDRLDEQLDAVMTEFATLPMHVRVDAENRTVHLSKIFDWYKDDFLAYERGHGVAAPSVIGYINRFRAADAQIPEDFRIAITPYDKGLNRQ